MSSKIDKEMLKNPDVFISTSDKVFNYVEGHFKTVVTALGVVLVGGVGYVANNYVESMRENSAATAIYPAEGALKKVQSEQQELKAKKDQELAASKKDKKGKQVEEPAVSTADPDIYAKVYAPLVENIKAQLRSYSSRKAALISAINLSYFLLQEKQYAEALNVLNLIQYQPGSSEELAGIWWMHRGVVYQENGQTDQALAAYQKVLDIPRLSTFHAEALLKQGVAYEAKGDAQKARQTYERIGHEFPKTEASTTALQYLRLLDLKSQKQG